VEQQEPAVTEEQALGLIRQFKGLGPGQQRLSRSASQGSFQRTSTAGSEVRRGLSRSAPRAAFGPPRAAQMSPAL
jgi:hypothetical protein